MERDQSIAAGTPRADSLGANGEQADSRRAGGPPGSAVHLVRRWGTGVIAVIAALNVLLGLLQFAGLIDAPAEGSLASLVDVNDEANVPTWVSTVLLAGSAAAAAVVARWRRRTGASRHRWWAALAAVFALASLDEAVSLHERLIAPVRDAFDLGGMFYSAWVVPGLVIVAALVVVFLRFTATLPQPVRRRVVVGAALFFGGALGFEMAGAAAFTALGPGVVSGAMAVLEETLELAGALLWCEGMLLSVTLERAPVGQAGRQRPRRAWQQAAVAAHERAS